MKTSVFFLIFCLPYIAAAAGAPAAAEKAVPTQVFCIFGAQSGKPFGDLAAFKSVIWKSDVVYAGGAPDRLKDQQARLEILKAMREARGSKIIVGFETLAIAQQPILDDYAAGKISEEDFLQKTGWQKESGAGFALYKPIFDFIIRNKLRALALKVPEEIIIKIEREGLAGLNEEEKKFLPAPVGISRHKKYLEFLKASFSGPGTSSATAAGIAAFDNRLAAVSSWNESAGARIADFLNANPGWAVLVAAGNDRLVYNAAVPASVKNRTVKLRQASFYAETAEKCPAELPKDHKDLANYIWYIDSSTAALSGRQ